MEEDAIDIANLLSFKEVNVLKVILKTWGIVLD
jgi:hypothetical protein